jgi:hypothetical protein
LFAVFAVIMAVLVAWRDVGVVGTAGAQTPAAKQVTVRVGYNPLAVACRSSAR